MELVLAKSFEIESTYELTLNGVVLTSYRGNNLKSFIDEAETWAKKYQKNLVLCKSAIANHFVGFQKSFKNPVIFKDEDFVFSKHAGSYAFMEGPFVDEEEAQLICFNLCGEKGDVIELQK